ncbi:hypothetical protein COCSUDRAFT_66214 [Coccomyxa subellipsoidea C-169]|uniref:Uncharacterized protein n=1 Tax=Coccomyxa subellipsoidea (strain C-169) TaxID=574566 RepID=I0YXS5_COCSC|nr:hypothetical protein COCSUDRAFT_66214 [Coccomyxa subellipsoidea C-169]EIE23194.1 hypothetical protein COCSUDRAFT_66214 [Coccomyxa subellipsoidea C-169]|eukprot:XP_005647738.1 hypothetical protein COCSUDRAFT_66214 [Coccomyxa subellipsoidea C-169]
MHRGGDASNVSQNFQVRGGQGSPAPPAVATRKAAQAPHLTTAYWTQRRASKAHTEERLRKSLYGQPEEYRQEVQQVEQQRVKEKQAIKQREEEEEMRWHQRQGHNPEQLSAQIERPWTISALSIPEHVAARARRAHQHEDNELNRRAAAENALFKRMHKEADRQAVNKELCREEGFFNFGAASEKWIAPELRVKHIHAPAVHRSSVFPAGSATPSVQGTPRATQSPALSRTCSVFPAGSATPSVQGTPRATQSPAVSRAASVSKPAIGMQHPWAWDAEPIHSRGRR